MSNAENVDPNRDRSTSSSLPSTPSSFPSTLHTSVGSANHLEARRQSHSRASSLSSAAKRRFEEALQEKTAEIERIRREYEREIEETQERLRREYEREYAKRLKSEIKKREEADKRAETAISKYNALFRELTMWRIRATRAKSALRHFWVRRRSGRRTANWRAPCRSW